MRLAIRFRPQKPPLRLPLHYNHLVQSLIYRLLDRTLAERVHDEGWRLGKRRYKFFTFSRLWSRRPTLQRHQGHTAILFQHPITLYLGSLDHDLLTSLATHLVRQGEFRLGRQLCVLEKVEVDMPPRPVTRMLLRTLSPITVYSTLYDAEGKKKTYYYSPFEEEFSRHIIQNLKRKALAWYGPEVVFPEEAWIRPVRVGKQDQKIIRYKGTVVKGWMGLYEAHLPEPYFTLAYYAGLGAKNSQGFGMVKVVRTGGYG